MNTTTLAAGVVGFLLGGLTVSIAAELENDDPAPPAHGSPHSLVDPDHSATGTMAKAASSSRSLSPACA